MNLDIDLEGTYFAANKIVLSGRSSSDHNMDAALLLTALRLACEVNDPAFSLDADDLDAWNAEGQQVTEAISTKIAAQFASINSSFHKGKLVDGLNIRTIAASRELHGNFASLYPNFRSRLVFRPDWLRDTRFGEILYKADLVLKELFGGAPVIQSNDSLRAARVHDFMSASARKVSRRLLARIEAGTEPVKRPNTYRLWFDIATAEQKNSLPQGPQTRGRGTTSASRLYAILSSRGYFNAENGAAIKTSVVADASALDVSALYPRVFVRRHDPVTRHDMPGTHPDLDPLAAHVNNHIQQYVRAYDELRALTAAFRAYVAAVLIAKNNAEVCIPLNRTPLLNTEKSATPLPQYLPSELFATTAIFTDSTRRRQTLTSAFDYSAFGGIILRAKTLYAEAIHAKQGSPVTKKLENELAVGDRGPTWKGGSGDEFITLVIDSDSFGSRTAELATTRSTVEQVLNAQENASVRGHANKSNKTVSGRPADGGARQFLLPYAALSIAAEDGSGDSATFLNALGLSLLGSWEHILAKEGYSVSRIDELKKVHFKAVIARSDATGEVIIAFGTKNDSAHDAHTAGIQFQAAVDLVAAVRKDFPQPNFVLTGQLWAGNIAAFVGDLLKTATVVTFNCATPACVRRLSVVSSLSLPNR